MKYLDNAGLSNFWNLMNPYVTFYGVCETIGEIQTKSVTVNGMMNLQPGTRLVVRFLYKNTCATPTIQLSSRFGVTPALPISDENFSTISAASAGKVSGLCEFVYEQGCWVLISNHLNNQIIYTDSSAEPAGEEGMIWFKKKATV